MTKTQITYTDWQGDESTLTVSSGGPLGILFHGSEQDGSETMPSLRHEDVVKLYEQLGHWLFHVSAGPAAVRDPNA